MSKPYYVPGSERASHVRQLFDRIARRYDLINDLQSFGLHRLWKRRLVSLGKLASSTRALDVCCGTGDLAGAMARRGAAVVGCDFSRSMLNQAKDRGESVHYVQADALALPFRDGEYDVVTIGYGLRNLADFRKGVSELLRVTRPGGEVLILDFGKPKNWLWRAMYFVYLRVVVPLLGFICCGDAKAYAYILKSLQEYPAQDGVSQLLRECGVASVEVHNLLGGIMSIHRATKPDLLRESHDISLAASDFVGKR